MHTFTKFVGVGIINTALDFLILNALLLAFGTGESGPWFAVFKSVSFLAAVSNSYALNKHLVFRHASRGGVGEPLAFLAVSILGLLINVSVASGAFLLLSPFFPGHLAANIGAAIGTLVVLFWNFSGYRSFVFRSRV